MAPDDPIPARIRPRRAITGMSAVLLPHTAAAEVNSGSTEGLQKLTGGPSSTAMTGLPSRETTRICRPPGAM